MPINFQEQDAEQVKEIDFQEVDNPGPIIPKGEQAAALAGKVAVAKMGTEDPTQVFLRAANNLATTGESKDLMDVLGLQEIRRQDDIRDIIRTIAITEEDELVKQEAIIDVVSNYAAVDVRSKIKDLNLAAAEAGAVSALDEDDPDVARVAQRQLAIGLDDIDYAQSAFEEARAQAELTLGAKDFSTGHVIKSAIGTVFDFTITSNVANTAVNALVHYPELMAQASSATGAGGKIATVQKIILDNLDDREFIDRYLNNLVALIEGDGEDIYGHESVILAMAKIHDLLGDPLKTDDEVANQGIVNNIFQVLDLLVGAEIVMRGPQLAVKAGLGTARAVDAAGRTVGGIAGGAFAGAIERSSTYRILSETNPALVSRLQETAIKDPKLANALGTTPEGIVEARGLPHLGTDADPITPGPTLLAHDDFEGQINRLLGKQNERAFQEAELTAHEEKSVRKLERRLKKFGAQIDKTIVLPVESANGITRIAAFVGREGSLVGFTDPREAIAFGSRFGKAGRSENVKLYARDVKTGTYKEVVPDEALDFIEPGGKRTTFQEVEQEVLRGVSREIKVQPETRGFGATSKQIKETKEALKQIAGVTRKSGKAALAKVAADTSKLLGRAAPSEKATVKQLGDIVAANKAELEDLLAPARGFRQTEPTTKTIVTEEKVSETATRPVIVEDGEKVQDGIDFFVSIEKDYVHTSGSVTPDDEILTLSGFRGVVANYVEWATTFSSRLRDSITAALRDTKFAAGLMNEQLKAINALNTRQRTHLGHALDVGADRKVWYDRIGLEEVLREEGSKLPSADMDKIWTAYQAVHRVADVQHAIFNNRLFNQLKAGNYAHMSVGDENFIVKFAGTSKILKKMRKSRARILNVFDPDTGSVRQLTKEEIEKLSDEGQFIMEGRWSESYEHMGQLIDTPYYLKTQNAKLSDLPDQVLNKIDGYIPLTYKTAYIVKKSLGNVNDAFGKEVKNQQEIVAFADNLGDAKRTAEENGGAKSGYTVEVAKEQADVNYLDQWDAKLNHDLGRMFYTRRSDAEILDVSGKRTSAGIFESIDKGVAAAARAIALDPVLDVQRKRILKVYADALRAANGNKPVKDWPLNTASFKKPDAVHLRKPYQEAIAHINRVNMITGNSDSVINAFMRRRSLEVADAISSTGTGRIDFARNRIAAALARNENSLDKTIRTVNFNVLIAWNPVRQKFLQMQQASIYAGIDHGFKFYLNQSKNGLVAQATAVKLGLYGKNSPKVAAKSRQVLKSVYGFTDQELDDLQRAFMQTGIREDIDGHQFATLDTINERNINTLVDDDFASWAALNRSKSAIANFFSKPTKFMRQIGFNSGELDNQLAAWLVARNKYIKNNPTKDWRSAKALDEINANSSALTLTMNAAGKMAFQQGYLGVMFQFLSFPIKMTSIHPVTEIPGLTKLGNKDFARREKMRIAGIQAVLYGPGMSLGLIGAWEAFKEEVEVSEEADAIVKDGAFGIGVNLLARAVDVWSGEEPTSKIEFSPSFAPGGGVFNPFTDDRGSLYNMAMLLLDVVPFVDVTVDTQIESILGPVQSVSDNFLNMYKTAKYISGRYKDEPTATRAKRHLENAATMFPLMNNFMKARLMQKTGIAMSQSGNAIDRATAGEAYARMLLGLQSSGVKDANAFISEVFAETASNKGYQNHIEETAEFMYRQIVMALQDTADGRTPMSTMHEILDSLAAIRDIYSLDPHEADAVRELVMEKFAYRDFDELTGFKLPNLIMRVHEKGLLKDPAALITKLRNSSDFAGKDEAIAYLEKITSMAPAGEYRSAFEELRDGR